MTDTTEAVDDNHAKINAEIDRYSTTTVFDRDWLTTVAMNYPDPEMFARIVEMKAANPELSIAYIAAAYGTPLRSAGEGI